MFKTLGKRSPKWFFVLPPLWLVICGSITGASILFLEFHPAKIDLAIFSGLSMVAALAICGLGYAGLRLAAAITFTGVVAGLFYMSHIFIAGQMELKGVIGLISGAQLAFIFFIVGLNGQMIAYLINKNSRA